MAPSALHLHQLPDPLSMAAGPVGVERARRARPLRDWTIPEAATGILLAFLVVLAVREVLGAETAAQFGHAGAVELGLAMAALGLVAALICGPIARLPIERRDLAPARPTEDLAVANADEVFGRISLRGPMRALLRRTPGLNGVSDVVFPAMASMSRQLWTLAGRGAMILAARVLQAGLAAAFVLRAAVSPMGEACRGSVSSAGVAGFLQGGALTAVANMTAVAKRCGPSPAAFAILPLVSLFFVDLANAAAIRLFPSL